MQAFFNNIKNRYIERKKRKQHEEILNFIELTLSTTLISNFDVLHKRVSHTIENTENEYKLTVNYWQTIPLEKKEQFVFDLQKGLIFGYQDKVKCTIKTVKKSHHTDQPNDTLQSSPVTTDSCEITMAVEVVKKVKRTNEEIIRNVVDMTKNLFCDKLKVHDIQVQKFKEECIKYRIMVYYADHAKLVDKDAFVDVLLKNLLLYARTDKLDCITDNTQKFHTPDREPAKAGELCTQVLDLDHCEIVVYFTSEKFVKL